jgi:peptidyl-prolyl cis-trans isomerase B (cyclophilin B)
VRRILATAVLLAIAGCGGGGSHTSAIPSGGGTGTGSGGATAPAPNAGSGPPGCRKVAKPKPRSVKLAKPAAKLDPEKTYTAVVATNCGTFEFKLDVRAAPRTTASIAYLASKRFYDHTVFHRIVPGFVIQGGDPTQTGQGGPGYSTVDKPPANTRYTRGVVAMAKTADEAPGTAGSQFFVVTGADAGLPADYAAVGKVVKGLDVVERIGKLGDQSEQPTATVEILSFRVTTRT